MKHLAFDEATDSGAGRCVRTATFRERSLLPVSAACVVANAIREMLGKLAGSVVPVRLFEPVIPDAKAWEAISRDAYCFSIRGPATDAAMLLRLPDALALAAWLFGESIPAERGLSALEESVVTRCVRVLSGALSAVCGPGAGAPERVAAVRGMRTFFEIWVGSKNVRIGVALAREPGLPAGPTVSTDDLTGVEVEVTARMDSGEMPAMAVAALVPGDVVPLRSAGRLTASLSLNGAPLASGELGVRGQRYAVAVDMPMTIEREQ